MPCYSHALKSNIVGRFEGLNDLEWKLFEDIFPETPKNRARGMPPVSLLSLSLVFKITLIKSSD